MQITSGLLLLLNQSGAESCKLGRSSAICIKLCIPYLVFPWYEYWVFVEKYSFLLVTDNRGYVKTRENSVGRIEKIYDQT